MTAARNRLFTPPFFVMCGFTFTVFLSVFQLLPTAPFRIIELGGSTLWICISCGCLNVLMFAIAWALDDTPHSAQHLGTRHPALRTAPGTPRPAPRTLVVEWRVLMLSVTLFLYSFGYGAVTSFSAMFADAIGVAPKSLYLTLLAVVILLTRPLAGGLADRRGHRRVLVPCLALIAIGLMLLPLATSRLLMVLSAVVFGLGFGTAYPVFVAYVMRDVSATRRGAAFGAILAAFDTGIGTGSTSVGWLIERFGFPTAFGVAAALSALALPYFLIAERRARGIWSRS